MSACASYPTLRVARSTSDLATLLRFYCDAAGFALLGSFDDHAGFSGRMVGFPGAKWHLELVAESGVTAPRCTSPEHLLVLYIPETERWQTSVDRMLSHGYKPVTSHNPYWDVDGITFEDPDGYRLVFQRRPWSV